jgi:hypothetical protein
MTRYTFTEPGGRVHAIERRWPRRGERAPSCAQEGCRLRARYVYHVGVETTAAYCAPHGEARLEQNAQRWEGMTR